MVLSLLFMMFIFGRLVDVVSNFNATEMIKHKSIDEWERFAQAKNVPPALQMQVCLGFHPDRVCLLAQKEPTFLYHSCVPNYLLTYPHRNR